MMEQSSFGCSLLIVMTLICDAVFTNTHTQLLDDILTVYDELVKPSAMGSPLQVVFKSALMQIIKENQIMNSVL